MLHHNSLISSLAASRESAVGDAEQRRPALIWSGVWTYQGPAWGDTGANPGSSNGWFPPSMEGLDRRQKSCGPCAVGHGQDAQKAPFHRTCRGLVAAGDRQQRGKPGARIQRLAGWTGKGSRQMPPRDQVRIQINTKQVTGCRSSDDVIMTCLVLSWQPLLARIPDFGLGWGRSRIGFGRLAEWRFEACIFRVLSLSPRAYVSPRVSGGIQISKISVFR